MAHFEKFLFFGRGQEVTFKCQGVMSHFPKEFSRYLYKFCFILLFYFILPLNQFKILCLNHLCTFNSKSPGYLLLVATTYLSRFFPIVGRAWTQGDSCPLSHTHTSNLKITLDLLFSKTQSLLLSVRCSCAFYLAEIQSAIYLYLLSSLEILKLLSKFRQKH